jgi:hypothetical protein
VNVRRGDAGKSSGVLQKSKTHCPHGHAYTPENTYINARTGARHCRACRANWDKTHKAAATKRMRRWRAKKKRAHATSTPPSSSPPRKSLP